MLFSLYNALGTFQTFINKTLRKYLDNFCIAYLDNILIFSKQEEDYKEHVIKVIKRLYAVGLYLDPSKLKFKVKRVKYLSLILIIDRIKIDLVKVTTITKQLKLRNVKDIQAFLGFTNFY